MLALVEAAAIRDRLGLEDDSGVNESIASCLLAVPPALSALLQTGFDFGTSSDVFFIDPYTSVALGGFYSLKLKNGFIKKDTVTMVAGDSYTEVQSIAPPLPQAPTIIMDEKGFVKIPTDYLNRYVRVDYAYGFLDTDTIPDWLAEVALGYAIKVLSNQQVGDQKPVLTNLYKFIDLHAGGILDAHLRVMGEAILAMN